MAVGEKEGPRNLVLGEGDDVVFDGEMGEKGFDFWNAHFLGVALVVEQNVAMDLLDVGLFLFILVFLPMQIS
jgi:hypothetical protein